MTTYSMETKINVEVDEGDILNWAADEIASRVEKSQWYSELRRKVDDRVEAEVERVVAERVALALDRGVTIPGSRMRGGFGLNSKTGDGRDWYPTMPLDEYVRKCVSRHVAVEVRRLADAAVTA